MTKIWKMDIRGTTIPIATSPHSKKKLKTAMEPPILLSIKMTNTSKFLKRKAVKKVLIPTQLWPQLKMKE